ncbi:PREDICTED: mitochondrial sodium/hydrogen exchanger 9B2-like [Dufourea novaeangliae]|uniref:mitochondrial sodium/hydrogen exchanger 9B2-like n=1 Tax=Dufourea novaeangliae TaxID=178035 RepID=UPI0007678621|nr:PREDICTED: mitochondrial sodium/hydrogen exchanger 9B2-like [Dufourea novaeangliae]
MNIPETNEYNLEDTTCCHRMTLCSSLIRNIVVTKPVSKYLGQRFTWLSLFWFVTSMTIVLIGWAVLYFLLGETMLPRNHGFCLYTLVIFSYSLGWSLSYIPYLNLPPVFGMLLAGLIVRNFGLYDIHEDLGVAVTSKIRTFCLTFIMIRAGLQLSITSLGKHPIFLIILAILPCSAEMCVLAVCCRIILSYPWDWSFMTGAILACMSPVVTVNCILPLAEKGYGEDKGLATILCTAACIDNVHIVSFFAVWYSVVFGNNKNRTEWWFYIPVGLRDFLLGIVTGAILGIYFIFFPHRSHKYATWHRMIGLILGSLMCTTATANMTISGGGYLACMILSFFAVTGWRTLSVSFDSRPFRQAAHILWYLVQPILVGVIGADIDLTDWSIPRLGLHLSCMLIGLTARSIATCLTTLRTQFTWKERLFVVASWLPKGTLQAALGPMALERVRNKMQSENIEIALDVVRISVITILIMAPIGAFVVTFSGPFLLNKISEEERQRNRELSYLRVLSLQPAQPDEQEIEAV